jgi:hypothetical protein
MMTVERLRSSLGRGGIALTAAAALTVTTALGVAPSAQAASVRPAASHMSVSVGRTGTRETFVLPAGVKSFSSFTGAASVAVTRSAKESPDTTITCTLSVTNPLYFTGSSSGVESFADLSCTGGVLAEAFIEVGMYYGGSLVDYSYQYFYSVINANLLVTSGDTPGYYQAGAISTLYEPAGTPVENLGEVYSQDVYIFQ